MWPPLCLGQGEGWDARFTTTLTQDAIPEGSWLVGPYQSAACCPSKSVGLIPHKAWKTLHRLPMENRSMTSGACAAGERRSERVACGLRPCCLNCTEPAKTGPHWRGVSRPGGWSTQGWGRAIHPLCLMLLPLHSCGVYPPFTALVRDVFPLLLRTSAVQKAKVIPLSLVNRLLRKRMTQLLSLCMGRREEQGT